MHPQVATKSDSATGAAFMTTEETLMWKRSTTIVPQPGKPAIHFAVMVLSDQAAEKDNVLYCGKPAKGILRFAPYEQFPELNMPKVVVDGAAPINVGAHTGYWANFDGETWAGSSFDANDGSFMVSVNCTTTRSLYLFLNFTQGSIATVPFYVIGKDLQQNGGEAGAPPKIAEWPPLPPTLMEESSTMNWNGTLAPLNTATPTFQIISDAIAAQAGLPSALRLTTQPPVGRFVPATECPPELGTVKFGTVPKGQPEGIVLDIMLADKTKFAELMETCVGFTPSPAVTFRAMGSSNLLALQLQYMPGGQMGKIALPIKMPRQNLGPQINIDPCNVTITVGHEKVAYLGQVFKQPVGKHMQLIPKITYRADNLYQGIQVKWNETGHVWVFFESIASTTNIEITASDGFFYNSTMCGVYAEFVALRVWEIPAVYTVHAGDPFAYTISSNLFLSSASYSITGVTEGIFNLESGVTFQSPSLIVGALSKFKLYNLTVYASNSYGSAKGYVLINSTNSAPVALNTKVYDLRALVPFSEEVTLNALLADNEGDELLFKIKNSDFLPSWLQKQVSSDTYSKQPTLLKLVGTATADYAGTNVTLNVEVGDKWNTTYIYVILAFRSEHLVALASTAPPSIASSYTIHPSVSIPFVIPFNLSQFFSCSTPYDFFFAIDITSDVSIRDLEFTLPITSTSSMGAITGYLDDSDTALDVHNISILARNSFGEAEIFVAVTGVNNPPNLTEFAHLKAQPAYVLGTFHATHAVSLLQPVSAFFTDPDGDELKYTITVDNWDRWFGDMTTFAPAGFSTSAATMAVDGTIPSGAAADLGQPGKNISMLLTCTDRWNTTTYPFVAIIAPRRKAQLIKPLLNYTVQPEEKVAGTVLVSEYFISPDNDLLKGKVQVSVGGTWITATMTGDAGKEKVALSAAPTAMEDTTGEIIISVENPWGDSTESKIFVHAVMSDWQRIQNTVVLASTLAGAILTVLGLYEYYPAIISWFKGSRVVIDCPLSRQKPRYHFPEDTEEVKVSVREDKLHCLDCMSHWLYNWWTLKPPPRGAPPLYIKVYDHHVGLRFEHEFDLDDPPSDCVIQFYNGDAIILQEFAVSFKDVYNSPGSDFGLNNAEIPRDVFEQPLLDKVPSIASPTAVAAASGVMMPPTNNMSAVGFSQEMTNMMPSPTPAPAQQINNPMMESNAAVYMPPTPAAVPQPAQTQQAFVDDIL